MNKRFISFDGTESIYSNFERPDRYSELFRLIRQSKKCIARGAGLSYCNASAGNKSTSISSLMFNRILEFDTRNGTITVEPGLTIGEFISFISRHNWYFPVIPGYPQITIGGCIAFNVHGKSQYNFGLFGDYIIELHLFHPNFGEIVCNHKNNFDLFDITIGGFGLTGFITKVKVKLTPLKGKKILYKKKFVANLSEAVDLMKTLSSSFDFLYSWNNLNKKGNSFGKGILYLEKFQYGYINNSITFNNLSSDNRRVLRINFLNKFSTKLMCEIYYKKEFYSVSSKIIDLEHANFPINGKEIYYKLFGKKGLREYQMIISYSKWEAFSNSLKHLISVNNISVALGSLKLFSGKSHFLNFNENGVCLTIEVPATINSLKFFSHLDELVIQNKGIINISKDSRIQGSIIEKIYPEFSLFKQKLNKFDPKQTFSSSLRQRINV